MDKTILYRKAYRMLYKSTPLKLDCGLLCNNRCCLGNDNAGMQLYPGEEAILGNTENYKIENKSFHDMNIKFAVCNGTCNRRFRPLTCRVFPLVPYISKENKLYIVKDPRAKYICPLVSLDKSENNTVTNVNVDNNTDISINIDATFKRNVYKVFLSLVQDKEILKYIIYLSDTIRDYSAFTGMDLP